MNDGIPSKEYTKKKFWKLKLIIIAELLAKLIDRSGVSWKEPAIRGDGFDLQGRGKHRERVFVCACDRPVSSAEAVEALARFGLVPGNIFEILNLAIQYPKMCAEHSIVALNSHLWRGENVTAGIYVPIVFDAHAGRHLLLKRFEKTIWRPTVHRFLAVERAHEITAAPFDLQ